MIDLKSGINQIITAFQDRGHSLLIANPVVVLSFDY
jgi:hypothetical protein